MNANYIKIYHPDDVFVYHIAKKYCKVAYQKGNYILVIDIESTEDLDHVEEDSLQNEYPYIQVNVEDFIIPFKTIDELAGNTVLIKECYEEKENEDEELIEYFYTNLNLNDEEDLEINENALQFSQNNNGVLQLHWEGLIEDFTSSSDEPIKIEVHCIFDGKGPELNKYEEF